MKILNQRECAALCSCAKSLQVQKDTMKRTQDAHNRYVAAENLVNNQSKLIEQSYLIGSLTLEDAVLTKEVEVINKSTGKSAKTKKYYMNPLGLNDEGKFDAELLAQKLGKTEPVVTAE